MSVHAGMKLWYCGDVVTKQPDQLQPPVADKCPASDI